MNWIINFLIVVPKFYIIAILFLIGIYIVIKSDERKEKVGSERYKISVTTRKIILTSIAIFTAGCFWVALSNPITKPMTINAKFVPEAVVEQVQEKAGDPLPSRLREPKQSSIQEKIDIKDEVKEILKK